MARSANAPLDAGDAFPALDFRFIDAIARPLPSAAWTVVLIYRGEW